MTIFIYISAYFLMLCLFLTSTKNTVFGLSIRRRNFGGVLIFREIFILVLFGVVLLGTFDIKSFAVVYVDEKNVDITGFFIFICIAILLISISFFSKVIFSRYLMVYEKYEEKAHELVSAKLIILSLTIILITSLLLAHLLGFKNAFVHTILSGGSLLEYRFSNSYHSNVPGQLRLILVISYTLLSIFLGMYGGRIFNLKNNIIFFILILYSATMTGEKAPILQVIFLCFLAHISVTKSTVTKIYLKTGLSLLLAMLIIFYLVNVQHGSLDLEGFYDFLIGRIGVGQIQGVYEQLGLQIRDWRYVVEEIPFSGFFTNPPSFSKDLMMATLGYYSYYDEIGVMNSLFIGHAYAIGGYPLLFLSPIIVALNFCFIVYIVILMLNKFFIISVRSAQIISPLFLSSLIMFTGDLNGLLFGKKIFMILAFLSLLYLARYFVRLFYRSLSN